eukprot:14_1
MKITDESWWGHVGELNVEHERLCGLDNLERLTNVHSASFSDNQLSTILGLNSLIQLEELSLEDNMVDDITVIGELANLRKLELGKNRIRKICALSHLLNLTELSLENNEIDTLNPLKDLAELTQLYIGNNRISVIKEVHNIRTLPKLIILDLSGNPVCKIEHYRLFVIYTLQKLKVLDGLSVTAEESLLAKDRYDGRLTDEFIEDKIGHRYFEHVRELDLSGSRIRLLDNLSPKRLANLRELNLERNNISDISALFVLRSLVVLRLAHNKISGERLSPQESERVGLNPCPNSGFRE